MNACEKFECSIVCYGFPRIRVDYQCRQQSLSEIGVRKAVITIFDRTCTLYYLSDFFLAEANFCKRHSKNSMSLFFVRSIEQKYLGSAAANCGINRTETIRTQYDCGGQMLLSEAINAAYESVYARSS